MKQAWLFAVWLGSAVMATLCCLPALLFLLFGATFSLLSFLNPLVDFRLEFSIIAVLFFILWGILIFKGAKNCDLKARKRTKFLAIFYLVLLVFLLLYPEILGYFYA